MGYRSFNLLVWVQDPPPQEQTKNKPKNDAKAEHFVFKSKDAAMKVGFMFFFLKSNTPYF